MTPERYKDIVSKKNPYSFQKLQYVYFHKIRAIFQFYEVDFFTEMRHFWKPDLGSTQ